MSSLRLTWSGNTVTCVSLFPEVHSTESDFQEDFNLDIYTEIQDLSHLENLLNAASPRLSSLNMGIGSLIEDYSLVGSEMLAVEVRLLLPSPLTS